MSDWKNWKAGNHAIAIAQACYEGMIEQGITAKQAVKMIEIAQISPSTPLSTLVALENALGVKLFAEHLRVITESKRKNIPDIAADNLDRVKKHCDGVTTCDRCTWKHDGHNGNYHTDCGTAFFFDTGTREENNAFYCHKCGKKIVEVEL